MTDVAVVIGNHQGAGLLPECIESLHRQTFQPIEILVADGGSTDTSRDVAQSLGARVLQLENRGLGALYNAGARTTDACFVLFSNNDVAYDERCIELLVEALETDERRFAADPRQLDWDGGHVVKARTTLRRGPLLHEYIPGFHLEHAVAAETVVPTVAAHGAAMLVRRSRFLELDGFDETFFLDAEDLDLCWRAWLRGWPSVYVPEAWLRHRVGATNTMNRTILPRRLTSSHHNMLRFALKCFPVRALARVLVGELLRLPRHPRVITSALAQVVRELPEILHLRRRLRPSEPLLHWMLDGQPE